MTSSTRRAVHRIGVVAGAGILAVGLAGPVGLGDHGSTDPVRSGVGSGRGGGAVVAPFLAAGDVDRHRRTGRG